MRPPRLCCGIKHTKSEILPPHAPQISCFDYCGTIYDGSREKCPLCGSTTRAEGAPAAPRECLRLQGWTDDRIDTVLAIQSDNQAYKQAGNGVTIPVVYAVGKRIVEIQNELNKEGI